MVQTNMKWIAEQVREGKSLLNIEFGETTLSSDAKLALIALALDEFPSLPSRCEHETAVVKEEMGMVPPTTPGPRITRLITRPFERKQNLFLPLELKTCVAFCGLSRTNFRVTQRARRFIQGNPSRVAVAVRRGWKNSITLQEA